MDNFVPGALQRLQPADIIRMAGLATAALGQEYCRTAVIHSTLRQGSLLSGVVDLSHGSVLSSPTIQADGKGPGPRVFSVEVEIKNSTSWISKCVCELPSPQICAHAAALIYQWVNKPAAFEVMPTKSERLTVSPASSKSRDAVGEEPKEQTAISTVIVHYSADLENVIAQLGLSELRGIAREYDLVTTGLSKQQLVDAILACFKQPEAIRRVASTLEKPQRQLLAALALAGGTMSDDDLRGVFERFSLGQPSQLQRILLALQGKALLFRINMHGSDSSIRMGGVLFDIGWHVPAEVRSALRVSVPVSTFAVDQPDAKLGPLTLAQSTPYQVLADLFLVARALDGYKLQPGDHWPGSVSSTRPPEMQPSVRLLGSSVLDSSVQIPPPEDMPSAGMISSLHASLSRPPTFLRWAVRVLRGTAVVQRDIGSPYLRTAPGAARLLLGEDHVALLRDLFSYWLSQSSHGELIDLQESGIRICCRSTALGVPLLRQGELEAENSEARQSLVELLAQAPQDQWLSFNAFARFVYRLKPLFLQKRQKLFSSPHWWLEQEAKHPLKPLQWNDWLRGEMQYVARLISGPLFWWGLCDIALAGENLQAFRLTPLATTLLRNEEPGEIAEIAAAQIDPAHTLKVVGVDELAVPCTLRAWPMIEVLEDFTEATGVQDNQLRYHLSPKALSLAYSRGERAGRLLELLREVVKHNNLPAISQMISRLEIWLRSYGRVRIYTGVSMIETVDAAVMRELTATTQITEEIVQSIHPTLHVIKKSATERLADDLRRRGQPPLLHEEDSYGPE